MMRSANEVMVLAAKAARGAGAPPAQAAQFGKAAAGHLCAGRQIAVLEQAMGALPSGPIMDLPLAIMRIAETAHNGQAAGQLARGESVLALSYVEALPYQGGLGPDGLVQLDLTAPSARPSVSRIELAPQVYERWTALAARLLVPESDASRLSGAGAGLSDND